MSSNFVGIRAPEAEPSAEQAVCRCSVCGSEDIEALAWVLVNGEIYVDDANPSNYWCPNCEVHDIELCLVDSRGQCRNHNRSVELCEREFRKRAAP